MTPRPLMSREEFQELDEHPRLRLQLPHFDRSDTRRPESQHDVVRAALGNIAGGVLAEQALAKLQEGTSDVALEATKTQQ